MQLNFINKLYKCCPINCLHSSTLDLYCLETVALGKEHEALWTGFSEHTDFVPSAIWLSKTTAFLDTVFSTYLDGHTREEIV